MKVGMIFECVDQGADIEVCVHLAKRIRPDISAETDQLGNKKNLLEECGSSAAQLLRIGCQKVFIVWDLYPSFRREESPCRHIDKEKNIQVACQGMRKSHTRGTHMYRSGIGNMVTS